MKKVLAALCLIVILGGFIDSNASASRYDMIPPVFTKSTIDQISHLEL